jgi:uncharacterized protein YbcV (DUF1398 family)
MDKTIANIMKECTVGSDEARLTFPQVVMKLMGAGVERYHADLVRAEKVYYLPDGESLMVASASVAGPFAKVFSGAGIEAAIRKIQTGAITYKTFCEDVAAAGCVAYIVSMAGRRAVYYGRSGETFVEPFPSV